MPKAAKGLTISRRSNGFYRAQIRKVGFPYQSKDFLTLRDADAWGMARLAEMEAGDVVDRRSARSNERAPHVAVCAAWVTASQPRKLLRFPCRMQMWGEDQGSELGLTPVNGLRLA